MRSIHYIAPVESMQGKLSGNQDLKYADNNNPAYEAPNGTQYARNYVTRYIGNRRSKDGANYFSVKQRTATTLTAATRRNMALIAVQAAWFAAIRISTSYGTLQSIYEFTKRQAGSSAPAYLSSFRRWIDYYTRQALQLKQESVTFAGPAGSVTLYNPYGASANATKINTALWVKFAIIFAWYNDTNIETQATTKIPGGAYFYIDGVQFFVTKNVVSGQTMNGNITQCKGAANPNMKDAYKDITIDDSTADDVLYHGMPVYDANGEVQQGETPIVDGQKLTTAAPIE